MHWPFPSQFLGAFVQLCTVTRRPLPVSSQEAGTLLNVMLSKLARLVESFFFFRVG